MYPQFTMKILAPAFFFTLLSLSTLLYAEGIDSVVENPSPELAEPNTVSEQNSVDQTEEIDANIEAMGKYEWKLVRDMSDIQIYMKHRDESKIKSFRGNTIMDVPDPYALAAVVEDFEAAPEWMHMMSEVTEIRRISDNEREVRLETRLPWPVKDRDATVDALVTQDPDNWDIYINMVQNDELLPEYSGYIRMPEIKGIIRGQMLSNQRMAVEMEFLLDPGGYIPPWLNNLILKDISFYTLKKLRKMLKKEKYQNKRSIYESWLHIPDAYFNDENYKHPSEIAEQPEENEPELIPVS